MAIGTLLWMASAGNTASHLDSYSIPFRVGTTHLFGMVEQRLSLGIRSIILIFGSCLLTIPWATTGLDRRVALKVLSLVGPSMKSQITVWLLASMIFSSCLPNVAVCALFTPIAVAMIHAADMRYQESSSGSSDILLCIGWGARLGGVGSPLGGAITQLLFPSSRSYQDMSSCM